MKREPAKTPKKRPPKKGASRWSKAQLDPLVEEATVDCYNESEQVTGLYTMIQDNLAFPFQTEVLGAPATVQGIDLPLPSPPPPGAEWIAACRHWARAGFSSGCEESDS